MKSQFEKSKISVEIESMSPLLMENIRSMDRSDLLVIEKSELTVKRKKTEEDLAKIQELEYRIALYYDKSVGFYACGNWIKRSMAQAGGECKLKTKIREQHIVYVEQDKIPLEFDGPKNPEDLYADERFRQFSRYVRQRQGIIGVRPIFPEWKLTFDMIYYKEYLDFAQTKNLLERAGEFYGIGSGRTIGCGRFKVTKFEELD